MFVLPVYLGCTRIRFWTDQRDTDDCQPIGIDFLDWIIIFGFLEDSRSIMINQIWGRQVQQLLLTWSFWLSVGH